MSQRQPFVEPKPSSHRLAAMFEAKNVVLIGATEKSFWSHLVIRNYAELGYQGGLFAVNRSGAAVFGVPGFKSCTEIDARIDVAFILLPLAAVPDAIEDIAKAGITQVVILTSGYAETAGEGSVLQEQLIARAKTLGLTIWGPNALGYNSVAAKVPVSAISVPTPVLPPSIAIIAQSGASTIELNEFAHSQNIGTSFVAATGNEAMIAISDVIDYLVDHAPTKAIAVFAETFRDPAGFIRAAERARVARKPIVLLKIGRSELAGQAARAHTGAIVGDDKVFDALCERLGVVRVYAAEDLVTTAALIAATGPLTAPGLSFISPSGGACTIVADAAESAGVHLPQFDAATSAAMREVLSDFGSTMNPLDVTGAMLSQPELLAKVIPLVSAPSDVGLLAVNIIVPTMEGQGFPPALEPLGRALALVDKPVIIVSMMNKALNQFTRDVFAKYRLPHVVPGIELMLRAAAKLAWWSEQVNKRPALPAIAQPAQPASGIRISGERDLLKHLAAAGVPVIPGDIAANRAEAERIAARSDRPLVLKIASKDIAHKTEVGGVRLNVLPVDAGRVLDEILSQVKTMRPDAKLDGVVISPMREQGIELLVGIKRDRTWGPMLTVGFGGVLVEVLADVATTPLPVEPHDVKAMLQKLRGAKLLEGYRGANAVDLEAVADAVVKITRVALAMGSTLEALEINPLLLAAGRVEALDALATWEGEETK